MFPNPTKFGTSQTPYCQPRNGNPTIPWLGSSSAAMVDAMVDQLQYGKIKGDSNDTMVDTMVGAMVDAMGDTVVDAMVDALSLIHI